MTSYTIKGKALLVVDAGECGRGRRTYDTHALIQSAVGNVDAHSQAAEELALADGHCFDPPSQCRKMKAGDRWRLAVTYEVFYVKAYDHETGSYEWDVKVEFQTAKTLRKQPWSDKRHLRYISKNRR